MEKLYIAYRDDFADRMLYYVSNLPGDGGADYGYTTDIDKALQLSERAMRRFGRYMTKLGKSANFHATIVDEPREPEAVTYTTAEAAYDWFGTHTIAYVGTASNGKAVRKVASSPEYVEAQRDRYASGCHMAVDEEEWEKLVKFKLVNLHAS